MLSCLAFYAFARLPMWKITKSQQVVAKEATQGVGSECTGNGGKKWPQPQRRRLGPSVCHALDCVIFASCPGPTHKSTCCKNTHTGTRPRSRYIIYI